MRKIAVVGVLFLVASATTSAAQGVRGEVRLNTGFLEARPLLMDSLPDGSVAGDGLRRRLADGTVVTCIPDDYCRWFRADEVEQVVVATQELSYNFV